MNSCILITGAAGGLGKAFAVECASRGYDIVLTDLNEQKLSCLSQSLMRTYEIKAETIVCDLADTAERMRLIEAVKASGLKFCGLINVAGLDFEGPFSELTVKQIRTIIRLNIEATVEMCHAVLSLRDTEKTLRIINVASMAAFYPIPMKAMYSSTKRFLLNFSLAFGQEVRDQNATVMALCPAGMPTLPEVIKGIEAQGILGSATTLNVSYVAKKALDRAFSGKPAYIPGRINQLINIIGSLLPSTMLAKILGQRWKKAYASWHEA